MPFRRRKARRAARAICAASVGEHDRFGEDAEAGALERLLRGQRGADGAEERRPRPDLAEVGDRARAIGIVEAENRRLREDVAGAEAAGMIRVAFDLRRPPLVAFDEQAAWQTPPSVIAVA